MLGHEAGGLAAGALTLLSLCAEAHAEIEQPWLERPAVAATPIELGEYDLTLEAEYRASAVAIHALSLNDQGPHDAAWAEHRLRLGGSFAYEDRIRLVLSADLLDGALAGYGNAFTRQRSPDDTRMTGLDVAYVGSGDPALPTSYALALGAREPRLRRAYGELVTDLGVFRIGRQAMLEGESIYAATGSGRSNRFGPTGAGDSVDRVLFVTKPLAPFEPDRARDTSADRGLFAGVFYDRLDDQAAYAFGDDLHGLGLALRWLAPEPAERRFSDLLGVIAQRWSADLDTNITLIGSRVTTALYHFSAGMELVLETGSTAEQSARLSLPGEAVDTQAVRRIGSRGVVRWDEPSWTAYLELDFASGDSDHAGDSDVTEFRFSPDTNVGLILFERVLAYESARSARAASFAIAQAGGDANAADSVATRGAFSNALAVYPQFDVHVSSALTVRTGVLLAWAPMRVVDPVRSGFGRSPARNFHGGRSRQFYGTELDLRLTWNVLDHFYFDFEGGVLFPGEALQDLQGHADISELGELRATFAF